MPTKAQLHELVDRIPAESTDAAARMLAGLAADPVSLSFLLPPLDDEPYTAEQRRQDAEAIAAPPQRKSPTPSPGPGRYSRNQRT